MSAQRPCCPPREALDALARREASAQEERSLHAHFAGCASCAHEWAWLQLEHGWMSQRAVSEDARARRRPALSFEALTARLAPPAPPTPSRLRAQLTRWVSQGPWAIAAAAAAFVAVVMSSAPRALPEEPWGGELMSVVRVEACWDSSAEAVAREEARFEACLMATPPLFSR